MLRLAADENFNGDLVRGLRRRLPNLDLVRVQDEGLSETADSLILDWAATKGRILVSHDRATMPAFAFQRIEAGLEMSGLFVVSDQMPAGQAIDELLLAIQCSDQQEWSNRVIFFPL